MRTAPVRGSTNVEFTMKLLRPTLSAHDTSRSTHRRIAAGVTMALAVGGVAVFAGPSATGASVSAADRSSLVAYIAKVDPICEGFRVNMAASLESFEIHEANVRASTKNKLGGKTNIAKPDNVVAYLNANLKYLEQQQVALKKQKRPTGPFDAQLDKIWKDTDVALAKLKSNPIDGAYTDPLRPMAKALEELGFKSCLQPKRPAKASAD